jgi:hypothetical protein
MHRTLHLITLQYIANITSHYITINTSQYITNYTSRYITTLLHLNASDGQTGERKDKTTAKPTAVLTQLL